MPEPAAGAASRICCLAEAPSHAVRCMSWDTNLQQCGNLCLRQKGQFMPLALMTAECTRQPTWLLSQSRKPFQRAASMRPQPPSSAFRCCTPDTTNTCVCVHPEQCRLHFCRLHPLLGISGCIGALRHTGDQPSGTCYLCEWSLKHRAASRERQPTGMVAATVSATKAASRGSDRPGLSALPPSVSSCAASCACAAAHS